MRTVILPLKTGAMRGQGHQRDRAQTCVRLAKNRKDRLTERSGWLFIVQDFYSVRTDYSMDPPSNQERKQKKIIIQRKSVNCSAAQETTPSQKKAKIFYGYESASGPAVFRCELNWFCVSGWLALRLADPPTVV